MDGLVFEQNSIDDNQSCAYAFADQTTQVREFGVVSEYNENLPGVDAGADIVREVLQKLVDVEGSEFQIYNTSQYQPQLEISRLSHEDRETVYEKDYSIKHDTQNTFINTGKFLSNAAIDFISTNYSRFDSPVCTTKAPQELDSSEFPNYYLYTDASYHPKNKTCSTAFVIIGENGGMYAFGQEVEPQNITRAELLSFIQGAQAIQSISPKCRIMAHTDCNEVQAAVEDGILIDKALNETVQNILTKEGNPPPIKPIVRIQNRFTDAIEKVAEKNGKFSAGQ